MDADRQSFEAYVRARTAALSRIAYLLTNDHHLAEDLVQQTFLRVASRWRRIVEAGDPDPYVRRVLYHQHVSWWRRASRRPEAPLSGTDRPVPDDADQVTVTLSVQQALAKLGPRQRAALILRYFEDFTEVLHHIADQARPARISPDTWPRARRRRRITTVLAVVAVTAVVGALTGTPLALDRTTQDDLRPARPAEPVVPSTVFPPLTGEDTIVENPPGPAAILVSGDEEMRGSDIWGWEGRSLVIGRDGGYRLVRTVSETTAGMAGGLLLSPDGRHLASGPGLEGATDGSGRTAVFNLTTGEGDRVRRRHADRLVPGRQIVADPPGALPHARPRGAATTAPIARPGHRDSAGVAQDPRHLPARELRSVLPGRRTGCGVDPGRHPHRRPEPGNSPQTRPPLARGPAGRTGGLASGRDRNRHLHSGHL
ncbi:SigE family RNA polymerase sigma factor [Micromonospora polyrhachis]|uniref:RNA polymerase sigma factor (Sigma-70 family) n=1 Tax=Micromonospora polyrhachis TaxID=1282883 RepID=A0A7W7WSJ5_9ACTN|nr:SigE family RNA polymerase sigma factor [Micromonospora polyrhachis]MBB4962059.1 RNA polymerase sigma factor (sigma-70 family) [Micromonospora polyrhachis]